MSHGVITITEPDFREALRRAREAAWDAAVNSLAYPDGSKVELMTNDNPFRRSN